MKITLSHYLKAFLVRKLCPIIIVLVTFKATLFTAHGQMRQVYIDPVADNHINKISFYSNSQGYVAFTNWVGFTSDSGRTFTKKYITISNVDFNNYSVNLTFGFTINGVKAFNQDTLIAYGHYGLVPAILYSINGGNTYKLIYHSQYNPNQLNGGITDMVFPENNSIGYAIDANRVLKTTNKGLSWFTVRNDPLSFFTHIESANNNNIIAFNTDYATDKLIKTSNGGTNWQQLTVPPGRINYAYFISADKGWLNMITDNIGLVYYTSNGGTTWMQKNDAQATPFACYNMKFLNDSTGYAIQDYFTVYKTTDSAKTWEPLVRDNAYNYLFYTHFDIQYLNNQLWAGGGHGFLELGTNGGGIPLPKAYFKTDTAGLYLSNTVRLVNFSKPGYQYKWYKNNVQISTAYHASYVHNVTEALDSIKLVVTNGPQKDSLTLYQRFIVTPPPPPPTPYTGWQIKPTNLTDNLFDVRFYGNYGILLGDQGIYYTTSGADNPTGWIPFKITTSATDSLLLSRTKFRKLAFNDAIPVFYMCGSDTVNHKAILFRIDLRNLSYSFLYTGPAGSKLNALMLAQSYVHAVGDNGLYVSYSLSNNSVSTQNFTSQHLRAVFPRSYTSSTENNMGIVSDSSLFTGEGGGPFSLSYSNNTGRKIIHGTAIGAQRDFMISTNKLYQSWSALGSFILDSFTKIKPQQDIQYNVIASGYLGNKMYIGTNRGIYKVYYSDNINPGISSGTETIEYQPTSEGRYINNIWFRTAGQYDTGYAVGPNGTLLKTVNFGGPTVPYSAITTQGNCIGVNTVLSGYHGTGTSCKWYVDDVFKTDNCGTFNTSIATAGFHTLKYIVSNIYGLADTSYKTIYVSPVPTVNLPVTVSDTILCKSEPVIIYLQNTQPNYIYELVQESTGLSFGSVNSNGGNIYFSSTPVSETGNYFIKVTNVNGGCSKNFTNKIRIRVEHTKSFFAANKINITVGQSVDYFQRSYEAASFVWTFNGDASIVTSALANPAGISYASAGQKTITLESISAEGCRDTATLDAVVVYTKPIPDDVCYVHPVNDSDYAYSPSSPPSIENITVSSDNGYYISGAGNKPLLYSRYGVSKKLTTDGAAYFAKYTTDGALSWLGFIKNKGLISASTTDDEGNIYIAGESLVHSYFYFNNGDSLKISARSTDVSTSSNRRSGFILKMDSAGKYLWHVILADHAQENQGYPVGGGYPNTIRIKNNQIIVTGRFLANLAYYKNGVQQNLVSLTNSTFTTDLQNNFIIRIKNDGSLVWHTYFQNQATNLRRNITGVGIDNNGNSYVTGYYENKVTIRDAAGTVITFTGASASTGSYLLKFDSLGRLIWKVSMKNSFSFKDLQMLAIAVDGQGNSYLTGSTTLSGETQSFQVINSNGVIRDVSLASYCLLKFDSAGIYKWGVGSKYSYYGKGADVYLKDNDLYTTGVLSNNGQNLSTFIITSTDGNNMQLPFYSSEFFIARYDTAGVLKRMVKSGNNGGGETIPVSLITDNNRNILVTGMTSNGNGGNNSFTIFTSPVTTRGADAFYAKLNPDFCYPGIPPVANAGIDKSRCAGDTASIGVAASGDSYLWTSSPAGFNSTSANPMVTPVVTTSYYLTVTGSTGLTAKDTVVITIIPAPVANAGPDKSICTASSTTIGSAAVAGYVYNWSSDPAGFTSPVAEPSVSPLVNTTYYLLVTNSAGCTARDTAKITINTSPAPTITISTPVTNICAGSSATFTAIATNAGPSPVYQWQVNDVNAGTNSSTFITSALNNNDRVKVIITNTNACNPSAGATSNSITMTVNPNLIPSVSISTTAVFPVCAVSTVTFTAAPVNGGSSPAYQWQLNNTNVGINNSSYSLTNPPNGAEVKAILTSNNACLSTPAATSNIITLQVLSVITPSISITGTTTVSQGQATTLSANIGDGGTIPVYQWQDSTQTATWSAIPGAVSSTISYTPAKTGDKIRCRLTSNEACASPATVTSSPLTFTVNIPTAISPEPGGRYGIRIYPNPAAGFLIIDTLKLSDKWDILEIQSIDGKQQLFTMKIHNQQKVIVPVSGLPSGMYMAILRNKSGKIAYMNFIKI